MVKPETGQANFSEKVILPSREREGSVGEFGDGEAFGELQRRLEAFGEAGFEALAHHNPVDHHVDVVLVLLVERRGGVDVVEFAVDLDAGEAVFLQLQQFLAILALAAADDGGKQIEAGALGQRHDAVDHLADGLGADRQAGRR